MPTAEGFSFWNFLADVITMFFSSCCCGYCSLSLATYSVVTTSPAGVRRCG